MSASNSEFDTSLLVDSIPLNFSPIYKRTNHFIHHKSTSVFSTCHQELNKIDMMEKMSKASHGNKNRAQRLRLAVGVGDGIGGIVLLGGGLAVAGLIAAFSIIKNRYGKNYDNSTTPSNNKADARQSRSVFHQNSCITGHETSKSAVTGDQTVPILDGEQEKTSDFQTENLSNFSAEESFSLLAPDGPSLAKPEKMIKNESGKNLRLNGTIEGKKENGEVEMENMVAEKNLQIKLAEEDEEENDDGKSSQDEFTEDEEESSEEESSLEEHSPTQSVEEEEKDGASDGGKECLLMEEGESSEGEWSMEDQGKREDESGEMVKLAVKENSPNLSIEEEDDGNSSEEQNIETEEESSQGKLSLEDIASMESAEKEQEDSYDHNDEDSGEEHVTEKEENSSEGTVGSSIESNIEAIWPAEMIEALTKEIKEMDAINRNPDKYHFLDCKKKRYTKNEDGSNNRNIENSTTVFHQKAVQAIEKMKDLTVSDLNRRTWVWSILVLLLLLLLLQIHRTAVPFNLICRDLP